MFSITRQNFQCAIQRVTLESYQKPRVYWTKKALALAKTTTKKMFKLEYAFKLQSLEK